MKPDKREALKALSLELLELIDEALSSKSLAASEHEGIHMCESGAQFIYDTKTNRVFCAGVYIDIPKPFQKDFQEYLETFIHIKTWPSTVTEQYIAMCLEEVEIAHISNVLQCNRYGALGHCMYLMIDHFSNKRLLTFKK